MRKLLLTALTLLTMGTSASAESIAVQFVSRSKADAIRIVELRRAELAGAADFVQAAIMALPPDSPHSLVSVDVFGNLWDRSNGPKEHSILTIKVTPLSIAD
ncbi:hypothetical protein DW352_05165 [Pseudolabrys taiwanensis]|uniref:Uncharacterized protein n=1 Tax=Pseudolabrys taiwanensis TaxID=331696 RepID=A0A345ZSR2_9HYPH|nr:hypothetical protein [Pseudolabrys taiwanensis]AXK79959.1 hypothetical protein DW352_05165 [Pseudolabrys taiwanensis]